MSTETMEITPDKYFEQLDKEKVMVDRGYKRCIEMIDACDKVDQIQKLTQIVDYLSTGDGERALHYLSDVRRLWCMLKIMILEFKTGYKDCLSEVCHHDVVEDAIEETDAEGEKSLEAASLSQSLLNEYELTLYSLRRLLLQISEESCAEAIEYLTASDPSPYKLAFILQNEQLNSHPLWKILIPEVMKSVWDQETSKLFCSLIS